MLHFPVQQPPQKPHPPLGLAGLLNSLSRPRGGLTPTYIQGHLLNLHKKIDKLMADPLQIPNNTHLSAGIKLVIAIKIHHNNNAIFKIFSRSKAAPHIPITNTHNPTIKLLDSPHETTAQSDGL